MRAILIPNRLLLWSSFSTHRSSWPSLKALQPGTRKGLQRTRNINYTFLRFNSRAMIQRILKTTTEQLWVCDNFFWTKHHTFLHRELECGNADWSCLRGHLELQARGRFAANLCLAMSCCLHCVCASAPLASSENFLELRVEWCRALAVQTPFCWLP